VEDRGPEQPLAGGNVSGSVVRVGDTVRRPATPSSRSVDALLIHLEHIGFGAAPRALGYDALGRQVLSFAVGHTAADPADLTTRQLRDIGALLRAFHDAMESFVPPPDAVWTVAVRPDREELICHHDLAPWNLVRGGDRLVLIDWDGAGPGSRLWDLAYACHGFVPLAGDYLLDDDAEAARLRALVQGYRLDEALRPELVALLAPRIHSMYELLRVGHEEGIQPWSSLWEAGHGRAWLANARYVSTRTEALRAALLA
jgi:hypothetical protein